jgi:hypothetical protein
LERGQDTEKTHLPVEIPCIRQGIRKKRLSFGHCPKKGVGLAIISFNIFDVQCYGKPYFLGNANYAFP